MKPNNNKCVLLFSGGRDSTLAAVKLAQTYSELILVTITSEHLYGIETVHNRLKELQNVLPKNTKWLRIKQPTNLCTDVSFYAPTCLPCHHSYVAIGTLIAEANACSNIAFGYTGYQATWPEQTKLAIDKLSQLLKPYGINLILPVYEINDIEIVKSELSKLSLSSDSLEQKCSKQITNIELPASILIKEIDLWINAMSQTFSMRSKIELSIIEQHLFKDVISPKTVGG